MPIISIEGNIGALKTTFLDYIRQHSRDICNMRFLKEPLDEWESFRDGEGKSILQHFYENPSENAFAFQMTAFLSRFSVMEKVVTNKDTNYITERSLETDRHVFAEMLYKDGKIREMDFQVYCKWHEFFASRYPADIIIYIQTSPEVCLTRIRSRGRKGEETITLEYLRECHEYHENMMRMFQRIGKKVILLNGESVSLEDWRKELIRQL